MRRSARRYKPIMTAYEKMLEGRVERREIKRQHKRISMNYADRLFEVCLRSLTPEALEAMDNLWFRLTTAEITQRLRGLGSYRDTISDLKELVSQRDMKRKRAEVARQRELSLQSEKKRLDRLEVRRKARKAKG